MRYLSLSLLLCLSLVACSPAGEPTVSVIKVKSYQLPTANASVSRSFNGVARAHDLVDLSFRVDGKISEVLVRNGEQVKEGQLLARLDKRDYQVDLDETKARMELTQQQYQRAKSMLDKELMSQTEYDTMYAEYLVATAQYRMAELAYSYTDLYAPFDGVVAEVFVDQFQNIKVGVPVASSHKIDKIEIEILIPDLLLASARSQQREQLADDAFMVSFDAYPEQQFKAKILEVDLVKDSASRSYLGILTVDAVDGIKVLEGMPAKVDVDLEQITFEVAREFLLPVATIRMSDTTRLAEQQAKVWVYDSESKTVSSRVVELGTLTGSLVEVTAGLAGGEIIITEGANRLSEGQLVELIEG